MKNLVQFASASVIAIAIAAGQARADGGTESRPVGKIMSRTVDKVERPVLLPCPRGSIEERFAESEGVPGFSFDYALGCMVDANHAGWVIRAGLACYDSTTGQVAHHKAQPGYCDDPRVRALPASNQSGDFWAQKTPPYAMRYRLIKYAVGSQCRKTDQRVRSEPRHGSADGRTISVWLCESVTTFDGMLNAAGMPEADPGLFHTREIVTLSSKRMEFERADFAPEPMLDFVVPKRDYDCNLRLAGKQRLVCD